MKHLTLIRHAKSSWSDTSLDDFDRPLNPRGEKEAPETGEAFAARFLRPGNLPAPDTLVSSPACRAITTAHAFAERIDFPADGIIEEPAIYGADTDKLIEVVRKLPDSAAHVILVGHNPALEHVAQRLAPDFAGDGKKFPTCGIAALRLAVETWDAATDGSATAHDFISPKLL